MFLALQLCKFNAGDVGVLAVHDDGAQLADDAADAFDGHVQAHVPVRLGDGLLGHVGHDVLAGYVVLAFLAL